MRWCWDISTRLSLPARTPTSSDCFGSQHCLATRHQNTPPQTQFTCWGSAPGRERRSTAPRYSPLWSQTRGFAVPSTLGLIWRRQIVAIWSLKCRLALALICTYWNVVGFYILKILYLNDPPGKGRSNSLWRKWEEKSKAWIRPRPWGHHRQELQQVIFIFSNFSALSQFSSFCTLWNKFCLF